MSLADHPDPQAKQTIATCIAQLLKVQVNDHAQASEHQNAAQTVMSGMGMGQ